MLREKYRLNVLRSENQMPPFNRLTEWLRDPSLQRGRWFGRQPLPPIAFAEIRAVDRPPRNEDIQKTRFTCIF